MKAPFNFKNMKRIFYLFLIITLISCNSGMSQNLDAKMIKQNELDNAKIKDYSFLECMYNDAYFPKNLVDKCKNILLELSYNIETEKPKNLSELYKLTHNSTNKLNDLQEEFYANNSEIETVARECLAADFEFISITYGFDADIEELIATRDW